MGDAECVVVVVTVVEVGWIGDGWLMMVIDGCAVGGDYCYAWD